MHTFLWLLFLELVIIHIYQVWIQYVDISLPKMRCYWKHQREISGIVLPDIRLHVMQEQKEYLI